MPPPPPNHRLDKKVGFLRKVWMSNQAEWRKEHRDATIAVLWHITLLVHSRRRPDVSPHSSGIFLTYVQIFHRISPVQPPWLDQTWKESSVEYTTFHRKRGQTFRLVNSNPNPRNIPGKAIYLITIAASMGNTFCWYLFFYIWDRNTCNEAGHLI